jgi:hypothetical protein
MKKIFADENRKQLFIWMISFAIINSVMYYFIIGKESLIKIFIDISFYIPLASTIQSKSTVRTPL